MNRAPENLDRFCAARMSEESSIRNEIMTSEQRSGKGIHGVAMILNPRIPALTLVEPGGMIRRGEIVAGLVIVPARSTPPSQTRCV